jgi:hypothetical protein
VPLLDAFPDEAEDPLRSRADPHAAIAPSNNRCDRRDPTFGDRHGTPVLDPGEACRRPYPEAAVRVFIWHARNGLRTDACEAPVTESDELCLFGEDPEAAVARLAENYEPVAR